MEVDVKELKRLIEMFYTGKDLTLYAKKKLTTFLNKEESKQLSMRVVGSSAITDADLIAFAKWLDDMSYTHRLKIVPKDLTEFYLKNKASILEQYS